VAKVEAPGEFARRFRLNADRQLWRLFAPRLLRLERFVNTSTVWGVIISSDGSRSSMAAYHYPAFPIRWLLHDKYLSCSYAARIAAPTKILVAEEDEVVPRASTERLRACFNQGIVAAYVVVPGAGHNTISDGADYPLLLR
jgi:pimeloyl-ACP methyl ester carboxylesterase